MVFIFHKSKDPGPLDPLFKFSSNPHQTPKQTYQDPQDYYNVADCPDSKRAHENY